MQVNEDGISARTGLVGVFGHPVRHSLSPRIHNAAFRSQGVDMVYLAFDVPPEQLRPAIDGLRALDMRGANLTVPHKESVMVLLDEIDPLAARIGAVNTIVNSDGRLIGHNTDAAGFAAALRGLVPDGARGLSFLVLGAGGAARAVVSTLVEEDAAAVWNYNRTYERAAALCVSASEWGSTKCEPIREVKLREVAAQADVIVNATSLGLGASVKEFVIPVDTLTSGHVVVDLVYGSGPTVLVEAARGRGAVAMDGREMLIMQAASSYRLWTGLVPPVDAMRAGIDGVRKVTT
ncbi:MAG: shikimate dehydrogenase [Actinobacteria bacterium RBG_16_64_13]|nr:MAG: shikimate dehydrogenase [Actinobacteria bacterium RBG_16_64_13]